MQNFRGCRGLPNWRRSGPCLDVAALPKCSFNFGNLGFCVGLGIVFFECSFNFGNLGSWRHKCLFSLFFVVLTFHLPSNLFAARGEGGPQTNWKASGRFLFVWLRRRRRPRNTVQILVFVRGPLLKTFVPLGKFGTLWCRGSLEIPVSPGTRLMACPGCDFPQSSDATFPLPRMRLSPQAPLSSGMLLRPWELPTTPAAFYSAVRAWIKVIFFVPFSPFPISLARNDFFVED